MGAPPTAEDVRVALVIAMAAWNLPLLRQAPPGQRLGAESARAYEAVIAQVAPAVRAVVDGMIRARQTTWRDDPRVVVTVELSAGDGELLVETTAAVLNAGSC